MNGTRLVICLIGFVTSSLADDGENVSWSKTVEGLQARIAMKETQVVNGTRVISAYLTLRNASTITNPLVVEFQSTKLSVSVVDETGSELSKLMSQSYSGGRYQSVNLVLPHDGSLTFNVSQSGLGIPKNKAALLDFGPEDCWIIDKPDGKKYFLKATLAVKESKQPTDERHWHGTIEIPPAEIPVKK